MGSILFTQLDALSFRYFFEFVLVLVLRRSRYSYSIEMQPIEYEYQYHFIEFEYEYEKAQRKFVTTAAQARSGYTLRVPRQCRAIWNSKSGLWCPTAHDAIATV
jgi:hypothetical protein